ncbi:exo-alpha-sialidase [Helicobacter canis]|uniref:exo-alpha-sialidase n=1 Tax=Helicobacter canis TaxID=29419 RepID=UPI002941FE08|nr:exo-alpha-sialidase [Helicobacter canis]
MTPSKRVKQWGLGLIIVFALVAVAFVWLRSNPPNFSAFVLDSSLESSVGVESSALDSRANPALEPSYFTIPNPTPSAHASSIVALEHTALPQSLRDSYAFMALFFAGSREGARDVGIYQSFFVRDSVLGSHSGDFVDFRATADHKSSSAPKSTKSTTSTTATPRIYEESRASLRDTAEAVARQSTLESSAQVDSMDCHADKSARNDKNNAEILKTPQAAGFADDFVGCRAQSKGAYLSYVTAALRDDSRKSAAKPTPKPQHWSAPREILTPALLSHLSGKFIAKLGNPVSFVDSRGRVHLFVVGVSLGGWATSRVYWLEFDKTLEHLHFRQELALSPFANLSFLVRSSALLLEDGGFILPLYHELARKYPLLLHFDSTLKLDSITKPLPTIGAKEHSKLQPSFAPLSATKAIGVYRSYTPSTMQVSLCELAPLSKPKQLRCQPPKTSNLINYNSSSVLFSTNGIVFLLHNTPPQIASHTKLESSAPESSTLDSSLPHAREQLWLFALVPESLEKERVEFVPLALLDSVESSEVSYPSVALSLDQVHIAYTYKRAYIKSLVLSKSALVRQAQEVLKRETQAESSSLPFALDSSAQARLPRLKKVRDD